jgi:hypothetical protein
MSQKQYTYEDWYEGKVILKIARRNDEPNPNLADWEDFSEIEQIKIREKQKSIFEQSVIEKEEEVKKNFLEDYQRTRSKKDLVNRLLKRFIEVFRGEMICDSNYCHTSDSNITFDFWYYQEMKIYIDQYFIGGQLYDFLNVHSPNSIYWNQGIVMPEVMVEVLGSMIRFLKSEKRRLQSFKIKSEYNPSDNDFDSSDSAKVIPKTNPFPDIFSSPEAYDFFCDLESSIVLEKEYVAGYAFIFHKLKDKKLNFPIKKNVRQIDFCDFLKDERGQKEIYPPKLPKRNPKRSQTIFEKFRENYLTSLKLK